MIHLKKIAVRIGGQTSTFTTVPSIAFTRFLPPWPSALLLMHPPSLPTAQCPSFAPLSASLWRIQESQVFSSRPWSVVRPSRPFLRGKTFPLCHPCIRLRDPLVDYSVVTR